VVVDQSAVNEQAIYEALLDIKQQVGETHATIRSVADKLDRHVDEDNAVEARVREVELNQAKQKGALRTWGLVGTGFATLAGLAVSFFSGK